MSAFVAKLSRVPSFKLRGLFATLFAVELREAAAQAHGDEGAYRWGL